MSQKRNKIIVLISICIIILIFGVYLYNYFINPNNVISQRVKKCELFLHKDQYIEDERIAYHAQPAVNCITDKNTVLFVDFKKTDEMLGQIKQDQNLIKSINLDAEMKIYAQMQQLKVDPNFQIPESFQICFLIPYNSQNKYIIYPLTFVQSHTQNELYDFYCSSLLNRDKLSDISLFIQQVQNNAWSTFISYFYLIPDSTITIEDFSYNVNKYNLIFQF